MAPDRDWLTVHEVAAEYPFSPRWLYNQRYLRQGPPAAKVGKRLLYSRRAIEAWLAAQVKAQCRA